ncbi:hypothetical protein CA606_03855 [Caulobacter vibrioides]|uniref:Uncharacterized protein n=1 Tax=Caulobacter vibrioides TaxID=155892 RepID=A0A290MRM9_CAUVI|nr:hypothetical protein [Caulobacter vibrioides]ATC31555.1 hypothetical protein CA606_03855 [Caulobacter vibrioides]
MQRLNLLLNHVKAFGATRPVALGVPVCALVGALAGLAMQTGLQDTPFQPDMEPARTSAEATAEPIAYPPGDLPDYVVGTDFLTAMQSPPVAYVNDEPPPLPPPPELPPYVPARHGLADRPPASEGARWPSERGDILDKSLPEDRRGPPDALMLADVAATGMTSR